MWYCGLEGVSAQQRGDGPLRGVVKREDAAPLRGVAKRGDAVPLRGVAKQDGT